MLGQDDARPRRLAGEVLRELGDDLGVGLEFGAVGFTKNDVRIPGNTGTKFDMTDLTGSGPDASAGHMRPPA